MSILAKKHFRDETAAFAYLEETLWANGVICPHCGVVDGAVERTRLALRNCDQRRRNLIADPSPTEFARAV